MIGSHNSTAIKTHDNDSNLNTWEYLVKRLSPVWWNSIIVNQTKTISEQIKEGVSALDIRIVMYNNKLYTTHRDIVDTFDNFIEQLKLGMEETTNIPTIFIVIDWNFHEKTKFPIWQETLRKAKEELLAINVPEDKIYTGTSWSNFIDSPKPVKKFYKEKESNLNDYRDFLKGLDHYNDVKVIFTQNTSKTTLIILELFIRIFIPILFFIISLILRILGKINNIEVIISLFGSFFYMIIQAYIKGLYNTPKTLHKTKNYEELENLANSFSNPEYIFFMVDFF